jgi:dienelactone hydrolase
MVLRSRCVGDPVFMLKRLFQGVAFAALLTCSVAAQPVAPAPVAKAGAPRIPTANDFGRLPQISSVTISPDGKYIAGITTPDGVSTFISIWKTDAMNEKPIVINPGGLDGFQYQSVEFVKNDRMVVNYRELVKGIARGDGSKGQDFVFRAVITPPVPNGKFTEILPPSKDSQLGRGTGDRQALVRVLNILPGDPHRIIVQDQRTDGTIYKVNVDNAQTEIVQHGSDKYDYILDPKGLPRGREYADGDGDGLHAVAEFKSPKTGAWEEAFRWFPKDREQIAFSDFDDDTNVALATSRQGHDRAVIVAYDTATHKTPEVAFEHPLFEAQGVVTSGRAADYGHVLGFRYHADKVRTYWVDEKFATLEAGLRQALGVTFDKMDWVDIATGKRAKIDTVHDFDIGIAGYSDDLSKIIVVKSGPKVPPEYYLLKDGKQLVLLGKAYPQIDQAALGETHLIQYPARDGLMIPAFVTIPPKDIYGPGPYPTIVTPHGGPWARDYLTWDTTGWTQYFAARGYVVVQPQYRGSDNWGQKLWRAGDREWGGKMEDDLDDAVKYLIGKGLTKPDKVAIHGYSYGGYASFDAAVRPNGIYRCAIAGAGLSEISRFQDRMSQGFGKQYQRPTVEGVSPLDHIGQVTIPVMAYHGDTDHNVPLSESRRFTDAMKAAGKPSKLVELPDMGHEINKWSPINKRDVLVAVDGFLKNECGMGGA